MQKVTLCIKIPIEFELTLDVFSDAKTAFEINAFLYENWQKYRYIHTLFNFF